MKFKYKIITTFFLFFLITLSCEESFLEVMPYQSMSEATLTNKAGVDGLLIGAYSLLDGGGATGGGYTTGMEQMGAPDDARIGTESGATAQDAFMTDATYASFLGKWRFLYAAVKRCNDILIFLPGVKDATPAELLQFEAETKFLRGVYYLQLAMGWKNVPWIDETINYNDKNYMVPNNVDVYPKIEADLKFAADNLTPAKSQVGRANSWAAKSFLVKTYMFQKKFAEAKVLLDGIIPNGQTSNGKKYALLPEYKDNFRTATKHGSEAVFTVQMSVNDGANGPNGNPNDVYNGTFGGPATCCFGWYQATFDLVDAFQTDAVTGLPLLDTYQNTPIPNDNGLTSQDPFTPYTGTLDPRLDWSVGRRGVPYLDWGVHPGKAWVRNQFTSGPYSAIKNIVWQARVATDRQGGGGATNTPYNMIRFADVLLWGAECEIEVGSLAKAEEYTNMVRARAANPAGFVKKYINNSTPLAGFSNVPAANYKVGLYNGEFTANGKSYARKAVRFERRLEMAMEHQRYMDLRRYDGNDFDQAARHNWVMSVEAPRLSNPANNYKQGNFVKGKHELWPIPLDELEMMVDEDGNRVLTQNPGW
ncbi:MAG: carbohydrate-binding protein SusD [Bacteroidetes bacterium GWE2_41_25]|nr:MAG: carbohydrate-binding protein SusD [Bacteroidetes bacterium GWA2_40_15]OFX99841.1 MAG: carbohydrate-binding protein SusD [Bacteroidetes bacterium GWE2_41_25]HAM11696.1 RagB/SusD family nutrient uptake outer membrane protein [Bacteroidales bacterium]HBH82558.1 RagB/SusD family nutrient uptake outer membrane protein [Bacteroidales bacterium]HBQ84139.1 RagB/SusD family nutrient uptake outer membrane protein [Bacteroidales bacterium]